MKNRNFSGKGYQIPPFPQKAYLPNHLKGLKEMVVFIPEDNNVQTPAIEALAEGKFLLNNPEGILFAPPGLGLLNKIEKDFHVDFTKMTASDFCEVMPQFILYNLHLAKGMELEAVGNQISITIYDSIYKDLYGDEVGLKSILILGCPIMSAVACALAKSTGKSVALEGLQAFPNGIIQAIYHGPKLRFMHFPLSLWDVSLWLAITAVILLLTSEVLGSAPVISAYFRIEKKRQQYVEILLSHFFGLILRIAMLLFPKMPKRKTKDKNKETKNKTTGKNWPALPRSQYNKCLRQKKWRKVFCFCRLRCHQS